MARLIGRPLGLLLALPLWLGGCLLPQPDTPPIPPFAGPQSSSGRAAAPAKAQPGSAAAASPSAAPVSGDATGAAASGDNRSPMPPAASAPVASDASPPIDNGLGAAGGTQPIAPSQPANTEMALPGQLDLRFLGAEVTEASLVPVGQAGGESLVVADGRLQVDLPGGEYVLELVVGGKRLRATKPVAVPAGGERLLEVTVADETITITESVPLEDAPAKASPTPAP